MKILATLPAKGRDLRLDLFRGVANWGIFLDHIRNNIVNWVTTRNYGFSDAADLFIFISGYTVAFVFARMMLERGFIIGASRLLKRVWQIYVAHVFLFVLYLAEIGYVAQRYGNSGFTDDFNIRGFLENPAHFLFEGLILRFKPVNMDVLPLYIVCTFRVGRDFRRCLDANRGQHCRYLDDDRAGVLPVLVEER